MAARTDRPARWKQDFPVPSNEDSYATRREFTKFLGLTSIAFFAGTCVAAARRLWRSAAPPADAMAVAMVDEIPAGGSKLFRYPAAGDPCILLCRAPGRFVAFNQNCTHLNCPVHYESSRSQLVCPCHHGFFSADDGHVLAGPPRQGLAALAVSIHAGRVWVKRGVQESG
jgi:Rieske Fe-S protein